MLIAIYLLALSRASKEDIPPKNMFFIGRTTKVRLPILLDLRVHIFFIFFVNFSLDKKVGFSLWYRGSSPPLSLSKGSNHKKKLFLFCMSLHPWPKIISLFLYIFGRREKNLIKYSIFQIKPFFQAMQTSVITKEDYTIYRTNWINSTYIQVIIFSPFPPSIIMLVVSDDDDAKYIVMGSSYYRPHPPFPNFLQNYYQIGSIKMSL